MPPQKRPIAQLKKMSSSPLPPPRKLGVPVLRRLGSIYRLMSAGFSRMTLRPGNFGGMVLMAISTGCLAAMYVAIRNVPGTIHPFEIVFFRNFFGLCFLFASNPGRLSSLYRTHQLKRHGLRGILNAAVMLMFFSAVVTTPLADVSALGFTAPLFASSMAVLILKEKLPRYRILGLVLGFAGTLVVLRPGYTVFSQGHALLLVSAMVWGVTLVVIKTLGRKDSSLTITLYSGTIMTPISLAAAALYWQWPDLEQLSWMLLVGALGTAGQISLAQSLRIGEASAVLPVDFLKLVWGTALGFIFFSEIPDIWTLAGGVLIFLATTYLALCEFRPRPRS